jgi:hypothetical protein
MHEHLFTSTTTNMATVRNSYVLFNIYITILLTTDGFWIDDQISIGRDTSEVILNSVQKKKNTHTHTQLRTSVIQDIRLQNYLLLNL